jgi:hypothetical protein
MNPNFQFFIYFCEEFSIQQKMRIGMSISF